VKVINSQFVLRSFLHTNKGKIPFLSIPVAGFIGFNDWKNVSEEAVITGLSVLFFLLAADYLFVPLPKSHQIDVLCIFLHYLHTVLSAVRLIFSKTTKNQNVAKLVTSFCT